MALGLPAGFSDDALYEEQTVALEAGDTLLFFTDGLIEIRGQEGLHFGVQGLQAALAATAGLGPEEVLASVLAACQRHGEGRDPDDDQTAIAVQVMP